ncbi:MAG: multicopper oxidase [Candidatus Saccharibacteria bacterium]|nr:multicopper oxidase [Candidatus Saccharibacteria bacterium]
MSLYLLNLALGGVIALLWLVTATAVSSLAYSYKKTSIRIKAWTGFVTLFLGILTLLFKVGVSLYMWHLSGWWYGELTFVLVLPVLLPICIMLIWKTVPRLWRVLYTRDYINQHLNLIDPQLVLPAQIAALGGLLTVYAVFHVDTLAFGYTLLIFWLIIIASSILLYWRRVLMLKRKVLDKYHLGVRQFLLRIVGVVTLVVCIVGALAAFNDINGRLPERYSMMSGPMETGQALNGMTNNMPGTDMSGGSSIDVTTLTEKDLSGPVQHFDLAAQEKRITLSSGKQIDALTFNGQIPGPQITIHEGDILEVALKNNLPNRNITLHWHGIDVPNTEDGVPGLTQDAVKPGETFTYRFKAKQVGTFWYHSHEQSSVEVEKGLFGKITILPKIPPIAHEKDVSLAYHEWDGSGSLDLADTLQRQKITPGTPVRLRIINTANGSKSFVLHGVDFKVVAIDGNAVNQPGILRDTRLRVPAGGRRDITFTMPNGLVFFGRSESIAFTPHDIGTTWSPDGTASAPVIPAGTELDLLSYGQTTKTVLNANTHFDREFSLYLDPNVGFYDGRFGISYAINGKLSPNTPMLMVKEGDKVKTTFYNRSPQSHPMHLHGHQMLVLSRNGQPSTGSPWWTDTIDVGPGESYEVAFSANNPGLWMDHCHNLEHAAGGMVMHLGYEGYTTPLMSGTATGNITE